MIKLIIDTNDIIKLSEDHHRLQNALFYNIFSLISENFLFRKVKYNFRLLNTIIWS